jgi:group I intron endonuclease
VQRGIIYAVKNCVTDHIYIGQTKRTLKKRWDRHKQDARSGSEVPLHRAIRKHGVENFTIEELCSVPVEWLDAVEAGFIHLLGTFGNGYNATPGGEGTGSGSDSPLFGKPRPESVRKKISDTRIRKGIKHDKETIERIAAAKLGKKLNYSPEARAKMIDSRKGRNNPFFGRQHSEEFKEKQRSRNLGKKQSPETIAKRFKRDALAA